MNPFTAHPHQQGITYVEHLCFAMGIAYRLFCTVAAFAVHAVLPFIHIEPRFDLEATAAYLAERNRWIAGTKARRFAVRNGARSLELTGGFNLPRRNAYELHELN